PLRASIRVTPRIAHNDKLSRTPQTVQANLYMSEVLSYKSHNDAGNSSVSEKTPLPPPVSESVGTNLLHTFHNAPRLYTIVYVRCVVSRQVHNLPLPAPVAKIPVIFDEE